MFHSKPPYAAKGRRNRRSGDGIFSRGGSQLLLSPARSSQGYAATFDIAIQDA